MFSHVYILQQRGFLIFNYSSHLRAFLVFQKKVLLATLYSVENLHM